MLFSKKKVKEESNIGRRKAVSFLLKKGMPKKREKNLKPNPSAQFTQEITSYFNEDPFL